MRSIKITYFQYGYIGSFATQTIRAYTTSPSL